MKREKSQSNCRARGRGDRREFQVDQLHGRCRAAVNGGDLRKRSKLMTDERSAQPKGGREAEVNKQQTNKIVNSNLHLAFDTELD